MEPHDGNMVGLAKRMESLAVTNVQQKTIR